MFNLFALTGDPANRRLRFSLSHEVQVDLTEYLQDQEQNFSEQGQDEIQFDGKYKPDPGEVLLFPGLMISMASLMRSKIRYLFQKSRQHLNHSGQSKLYSLGM